MNFQEQVRPHGRGSQCIEVNVTVSIEFALPASEVRFTAPVVEVRANSDIELSSLIAGYWLFDFKRVSVRFQADSVNAEFALNPVSGLLCLLDLSRNSEINVSVFHANQKLTSTYLKVVKQHSRKQAINATVFISQYNFKETVDVLQLPTDEFSRVLCLHIEQLLCQRLFRLDSNWLKLNRTLLLQTFSRQQTIRLVLAQTNNKLSVNVLVQLPQHQLETQDVDHLVTIVNTSVSTVAIHLANKSQRVRVLRVKNLVTNTEVIGVDYSLVKDARFIEIRQLQAIEVDQIYSFDLVDLTSEETRSFYLVRSSLVGKVASDRIVKRLSGVVASSGQLVAELAQAGSGLGTFEQRIFVLDSSVSGRFKVRDGCLWMWPPSEEGAAGLHEAVVVELVVDKVSLRVKQIRQLVVAVELVEELFFVEVEMRKSEVKSGSLVYEATGEVKLVGSEKAFRTRGNKVVYEVVSGEVETGVFGVEVIVNGAVVYVEVSVVEDEAVVFGLFGDVNEQRFEMGSGEAGLVGRIGVPIGGQAQFEFEMLDRTKRFRVDRQNGLLFATSVEEVPPELYSLSVGVRGRVGARSVSGVVSVVVRVRSVSEVSEAADWVDIRSRQVNVTEGQGTWLMEAGAGSGQRRIRLLPTGEERPCCEVNWLDGKLSCCGRTVSMYGLVYELAENGRVRISEYVQIHVNAHGKSSNSSKSATLPSGQKFVSANQVITIQYSSAFFSNFYLGFLLKEN